MSDIDDPRLYAPDDYELSVDHHPTGYDQDAPDVDEPEWNALQGTPCPECDDTGLVEAESLYMDIPGTMLDFCDCPIGQAKESDYSSEQVFREEIAREG